MEIQLAARWPPADQLTAIAGCHLALLRAFLAFVSGQIARSRTTQRATTETGLTDGEIWTKGTLQIQMTWSRALKLEFCYLTYRITGLRKMSCMLVTSVHWWLKCSVFYTY
jgi:hypothetical protein